MPAFGTSSGGHLTVEQVNILADGIKQHWGPVEPVPKGAPSYMAGRTAGDKEAGSDVFMMACASCHGEQGEGGEYRGKSVGAINDPDFLALVSDQGLRRFVITGRPDLGMPAYADAAGRPKGFTPLASQDVADVTALMASWRQGRPRKGREN